MYKIHALYINKCTTVYVGMAQWKRVGPISQRTACGIVDRNLLPANLFIINFNSYHELYLLKFMLYI